MLPTVLVVAGAVSLFTQSSDAKVIPNAYIVQVADAVDVHQAAAGAARFTGGNLGHIYTKALRGFAIRVPPGIKKADILAQPGVVLVEPDLEVTVCAQTLPTGVNRIDVDLNNTAKIDGIDERIDVDIAIIDTGIDTDHPDLYVVGGRHFYNGGSKNNKYDDDHGHGSHVAGIAAALDNNIGVVGVAPGARLWAVKVLDASGSGYLSDAIAGVDWVTGKANQIEVANMSIGATGTSDMFRTAIQHSVDAGIVYVVAAGNAVDNEPPKDVYGDDGIFNTSDDFIPAAYPEVATISAMADSDGQPGGAGASTGYGDDDSFATFSNFSRSVVAGNPVTSPGAAIDLLMPGVNIYSTYKNGGYATMSGTSMASPHAAGLAALYIAVHGRATDAAGVYAIRQALIDGGVAQDSAKGLAHLNDRDANWENIGWAGPAPPARTLTVISTTGGTVTQPGIGDFNYPDGNVVNLVASANANYHFVNWTGTAVTAAKVADPNSANTTVTMDANYTVQANFAIDQRTLTVSSTVGGSVTQPGEGAFQYNHGTVVDLNAVPAVGYHFVNWTGDIGTIADVNAAATTITMDANYAIQANFAVTQFTITASAGANGTVEPTSVVVNYGSNQDFNAIPNISYEVNEWFLDGNSVQSGGTTYTLPSITAAHTVYVTFKELAFAISGYVLETDGNTPVEGVLIQTDNNDINSVTDANGYYELLVDYGWSGIVTPQKECYIFEPNSILYNNVVADEVNDYTATLSTFAISGYILEFDEVTPISDVNVAAENGGGPYTSRYGGSSDMTDANGCYKVVVDCNWSGKVIPAKYAYAFEPNSRAYANVIADQNDQNYAGKLLTFAVSGCIWNDCNVPIKGIVVTATNGGISTVTDANGHYEVWVDYNWSVTVTPGKSYYTFAPTAVAYTAVLDDRINQNYLAANIYDLDCDGSIDYGDVRVISDNWLDNTVANTCDFNADVIVNFNDYAEFANVWTTEYGE
jgi:subtilisin family serine protease